jgi:hypothetical protein
MRILRLAYFLVIAVMLGATAVKAMCCKRRRTGLAIRVW